MEWLWRQRCLGTSPATLPSQFTCANVAELDQAWQGETRQMRAFLGSIDEAALEKVIVYRNTRDQDFTLPLWQILAHVVNHGTQHRTEAAMTLTHFGCSPGDIDLTVFLREGSTGRSA